MTPPPLFKHQQKLFDETWELPSWAYFLETGAGKSAPAIHTAVRLFELARIDTVIVVAPGGVHRNWITDEVPLHCAIPWRGLDWHSSRAKAQDRAHAALCAATPLRWFAISYDALVTPRGRKAVLALITGHKFLLIVDEGSRVKNPTAERTKKVSALRQLAAYARLLNGTPVSNSPCDLYAQMKLLDERFWLRHGIGSYTAFQARFTVTRKIVVGGEDDSKAPDGARLTRVPIVPLDVDGDAYEQLDLREILKPAEIAAITKAPTLTATPATTGRTIEVIVGYRELDKLHAMIQPMSTRLTKEQAGLNLPAKLYQRIVFELAPEQRRIYDTMRKEFMVELASGALITAPIAMVRIMRLQQIACGYLPNPDDLEGEPILIPGLKNPRLTQFLEWGEDIGKQQAIVWARFTHDVDSICRQLGPAKCVRYDGKVNEKDKAKALDQFRGGDRQFCVAKASSMGMGLTMVNSSLSYYYSNTFSLLERLQSEDRQHRPGQHHAVTYVDSVAENTVDEKILKSLRERHDIAARVTGDQYKEWLS
jgi:hypothetical protein